MYRIRKNKKGFTLVEMMLSLAIICLIGVVIGAVCASITSSFGTTYNIDDSADYALLYAQGFENSFLSSTQSTATGSTFTWSVMNSSDSAAYTVPTLVLQAPAPVGESAVFVPQFIGSSSGGSKWKVCMFYNYDSAKEVVAYNILVADNYGNSDFVYCYSGSFWVPRFQERATNSGVSGRSITVSGNEMNTSVLKSKYGFSDEQANAASMYCDSSFKSEVVYNAG